MSKHFGLFEAYGIEIELMIVRSADLAPLPIADELMREVAGEYVSDIDDGPITWSNELVSHVIELKTTQPARDLEGLAQQFHKSVLRINALLAKHSARLMPTAIHPFLNPLTDTKLWQHDNNEVYDLYNKIFDCRGHGWSNLQSMHINLPFRTDEEFRRLHSSIRAILPLLPALCASSPIVEGRPTGIADARLKFYQENQKRIPSIAGQVIPDVVLTKDEYHKRILAPIFNDIAPYDPDNILREDWLNSRGAIARFGRQSIEIRVMDSQECPEADLCLADLVVRTLKHLAQFPLSQLETLEQLSTSELKHIFDSTVEKAEHAVIANNNYLLALGFEAAPMRAGEVWAQLQKRYCSQSPYAETQSKLLASGSLATRIMRHLGPKVSHEPLISVYQRICDSLISNKLFGAN